jgi:hypothetical protein
MSDRTRKPTPYDFSEDEHTPVEAPLRMQVVPVPTEGDEVDPEAPLWEQVLQAVKSQGHTLVTMQGTLNVMHEMLQSIVPRLSAVEAQLAKRALKEIAAAEEKPTTDPRT